MRRGRKRRTRRKRREGGGGDEEEKEEEEKKKNVFLLTGVFDFCFLKISYEGMITYSFASAAYKQSL